MGVGQVLRDPVRSCRAMKPIQMDWSHQVSTIMATKAQQAAAAAAADDDDPFAAMSAGTVVLPKADLSPQKKVLFWFFYGVLVFWFWFVGFFASSSASGCVTFLS